MGTYKLVILLLFSHILYSRSACILIHGTWAQSESWYQQHGSFFKAINRCNQELGLVDEVIPFAWSGKLSYQCQKLAAEELIKIIKLFDELILIGHSHGATVAMIASQILKVMSQQGIKIPKIQKLYALGVPVELDESIVPDMQVIQHCFNLFSFADFVQPVNGAYKRTFVSDERIINMSVMINGLHPGHSALHDPVLAKDLLKIPEFFMQRGLGNFETFQYCKPGCVQFFDYDLARYDVQHDQKSLLELDKKVQWMMTMALFRYQNNTN